MGLFSAIGGSVCSAVGSLSSVSSEPDLDLDEKRRQMDAMIETQNKKMKNLSQYLLIQKLLFIIIEIQNKKMKNLSLNDKYKLDDSKEFFAKLDKDKK